MYLALDIGGTKTEAALFRGKDVASLAKSKKITTPQDYEEGRRAIFHMVDELLVGESIRAIHVSFPGVIRGTQILQSSNIPDYYDRPLKADLEQRYKVPVSIMQDSVCSAIAEFVYGDLDSYRKIVYLIMGTGIGGAFIQRSSEGVTMSPLEPGGMVVDFTGARSHPFTQTSGLLEAYVGGGMVETTHKLRLADVPDDDHLWAEIIEYLAAGINNLNCILMPDVVVIGGGIGLKRQVALKPVSDKIQVYKEFVLPPKVEFTKVNGNTSLLGALAANFVSGLTVD
jgi:predicted NBD/HSP70 family sugar kinase